uniref:Uncharacterized protein n=1 Tax=Arundo donax TaxID=35708 RepID=A0A0A9JNV9_ARUDO
MVLLCVHAAVVNALAIWHCPPPVTYLLLLGIKLVSLNLQPLQPYKSALAIAHTPPPPIAIRAAR